MAMGEGTLCIETGEQLQLADKLLSLNRWSAAPDFLQSTPFLPHACARLRQ